MQTQIIGVYTDSDMNSFVVIKLSLAASHYTSHQSHFCDEALGDHGTLLTPRLIFMAGLLFKTL